MTLTESVFKISEAIRAAGYPSSRVEIHIAYPDVIAATHEPEIARMVIDQAFRPSAHDIPRPGLKFMGMLYHVAIYAQKGPDDA